MDPVVDELSTLSLCSDTLVEGLAGLLRLTSDLALFGFAPLRPLLGDPGCRSDERTKQVADVGVCFCGGVDVFFDHRWLAFIIG